MEKNFLNKWQALDFHSPDGILRGGLLYSYTKQPRRERVPAFHAEPTFPSWQGRLRCRGSSFGVPDLGINDLIRSAGEGKGRREGKGDTAECVEELCRC